MAPMRVGIDAQVVFACERSGLYQHMKGLVAELCPLLNGQCWVLAANAPAGRSGLLASTFPGAQVCLVSPPRRFYRLWHWLSRVNRFDVLLHMLFGQLPPTTRGANVYVVPDIIPLAFDYGKPAMVEYYRRFSEQAIRHGHAIIVSSEHTKKDLLERVGGDAERIHVCPLAAGPEFAPVDPALVRAALAPLGLSDMPYVLCVATLQKAKNHVVLLRAFAQLLQRDPALPHKLVFVGGKGIGHEEVFDVARTLGLGDRFMYLGFVEALPPVYAGADAFVFPSLYEGFGLPPLEAMSCGVPVLAARATSLPEVVGDAGMLFEPHDERVLADELYQVLTDRVHHDCLAARGLARSATYSWRRTAESYLGAFKGGLAAFRRGN
jgi:glycosyltransferase involved in cell wall biosynthesis